MNQSLTKREEQIAERLVWGWSKKELAAILDVSVSTVANHARNIYQKIGARSVNQLTAWWLTNKYQIQNPFLSLLFLCMVSINEIAGNDLRPTSGRVTVKTVKGKRKDN
jgi:DNA-binding CsgD family transcriptional regulator